MKFNRQQLKMLRLSGSVDLIKRLTYGLQTLDHPVEDVGLDRTLGPVLLQRRQSEVHLFVLLFPVQTFEVAVVQHQRVIYCHAGDKNGDV